MKLSLRFGLLVGANVLFCCMLSLQQPSSAQNQPFANSVEQRFEMIRELKGINAQLKEQNALLRSGNLRVVIEQKR